MERERERGGVVVNHSIIPNVANFLILRIVFSFLPLLI